MHAAVNFTQIQPGKMNEAIAIFRDVVVPAASQQQGNSGGILLTDPNTNKAIAVGLWETEADAAAVITSGWYQEQIAKFASVFAAPPVREVYEVGADAWATSEGDETRSARVNYIQVQPGKMDDLVNIFQDSVVPVLQQLQGFKRELILTDRNTSKVFAVPLWETEADMIASETSGWVRESFDKFVGVFAGPPVTEHYEVSVQV